jgi:hypothetical protein
MMFGGAARDSRPSGGKMEVVDGEELRGKMINQASPGQVLAQTLQMIEARKLKLEKAPLRIFETG